ncbi:MAG: penicillin-binding protein activator [Myxococcota bacterium]|nr:penicillin-binding protein activator [Myxococcota bacterium]MDW8362337.1 penicillin-binding protein activator [Myxococcales bacterium]
MSPACARVGLDGTTAPYGVARGTRRGPVAPIRSSRTSGCVATPAPLAVALGRASLGAVALWVAVWLAWQGCAGSVGGRSGGEGRPLLTTDDPRAEADLRAAREAEDAERFEEARVRYRAFLERHRDDPLVPVAHLGLGRLLVDGDPTTARMHLAVAARCTDAVVAERARFWDAVALARLGQYAAALDALRPFVGRTVDPEETGRLFATMAEAARRIGDGAGALAALDALLAAPVRERERAAAYAHATEIVASMDAAGLDRALATLPPRGAVWPMGARRAVQLAFDRGDLERVREIVAAMREAGVPLDETVREMALRAERTEQVDLDAIGVLVPLSGRGRAVGQHALEGAMTVLGPPQPGAPRPGQPRLVVRDEGESAERAVRAVVDLATLHRVAAIVGPLSSAAAEPAARRAQELGVPILVLAPRESVTASGGFVFRLQPTALEEARRLVAEARARGASRFAVLHPDDESGRTQRAAFELAVREAGVSFEGARAYPADGRTIAAVAAELPRTADAVFVPDVAARVAVAAPAIVAAWSGRRGGGSGSTPPRLLVPSIGFDPQVLAPISRQLEGALLGSAFHAPWTEDAAASFVVAYRDRFQRLPDVYAATAADAVRLIRQTLADGARTRREIADRLSRPLDSYGPSGGLGPDRGPRRALRVYEMDDGALVPLP